MNGELYFCGHHAREYMPSLKAQALEVFEDPAYQEAQAQASSKH
jgi:hypothetical protein